MSAEHGVKPLSVSPLIWAKKLPFGTLTSVAGLGVGVAAAGIRSSGGHDLLVISHPKASVAGVTTRSTAVAAPCLWTRARVPGVCDAVVVNAGNANAATGDQGALDAAETARLAGEALGVDPEGVLLCSTGVIGRLLPMDKVRSGVAQACGSLKAHAGHAAACAILTTDTGPKEVAFESGGITVSGMAKGAGMIHPNMATMLGFLATDAQVEPGDLQRLLEPAVAASFNSISVDGDTSTNDTVLLIATGQGEPVRPDTPAWTHLRVALESACRALAMAIAADGEGATCLLEVLVEGALDTAQARRLARAVVKSNLVKTAVYGKDPNWGRIVGALGQAQAPGLAELDLDIGGVPVVRKGQPLPLQSAALKQAMSATKVVLHVRLGGESTGTARAWGCDMSAEYVRINADYTS